MAAMTATELWEKLVRATQGNEIYALEEIARRTGLFWECSNSDDFAWRCGSLNPADADYCYDCTAFKPE